jgi:acylphosphatase
MDHSKRVRVRVTGVVQGVSYRASTQAEARDLGVVGWVKNEPDGAVLLEAQGAPAAVDALIAWCRQGPAFAEVDAVDVTPIAVEPGATRFEIRR